MDQAARFRHIRNSDGADTVPASECLVVGNDDVENVHDNWFVPPHRHGSDRTGQSTASAQRRRATRNCAGTARMFRPTHIPRTFARDGTPSAAPSWFAG